MLAKNNSPASMRPNHHMMHYIRYRKILMAKSNHCSSRFECPSFTVFSNFHIAGSQLSFDIIAAIAESLFTGITRGNVLVCDHKEVYPIQRQDPNREPPACRKELSIRMCSKEAVPSLPVSAEAVKVVVAGENVSEK